MRSLTRCRIRAPRWPTTGAATPCRWRRGAKHPDTVWQFIEWITANENNIKFAVANDRVPIRESSTNSQAYIQGRINGRCYIGDHVWIGPQCYFDARDLIVESYVGWGPGAKVLGSTHVGLPIEVPIIQTDLEIKQVKVEAWADIGVNAVILPGVTIGRGSIVGAGAVVTENVPPFAVVAGVPARFLRWREGYSPVPGKHG